MTVLEQKRAQRAAGIAARRALGPAQRAAANAALCARAARLPCFRAARTVLAYAAFDGEADLAALLDTAARQGKAVAYPVCGADGSLLAALPAAEGGWEAGRYGIRTPVLARARVLAPAQLDLVLVPCTAVDARCGRVGMGKGYYDRYLPRCTRAAVVGVAFEAQRVDAAACEPHDIRPALFVTEGGIYHAADPTEL